MLANFHTYSTFTLAWNKPNNYNYWTKTDEELPSWKNYYATVFDSSVETAIYCQKNFNSLFERTIQFIKRNSKLFSVLERVGAPLNGEKKK